MSEAVTNTVDVDAWVRAAHHEDERRIRRVMRIILHAVAHSPLKSRMVIKGGVLLALGYQTGRHTRDVDFSTEERVQQVDRDEILSLLDKALVSSMRDVDPEILCRIQSQKMLPSKESASFPTLRIGVGYATQGETEHRRMIQGRNSSKVVTIDLSFNEQTCITSRIALDGDSELIAYSLYDQIAEKYRALIQQTGDRRDRVRRQDAYDIYQVIEKGYLASAKDRATLLDTMRRKFAARQVFLDRETIDEPEIAGRAQKEYRYLAGEIEGELQEFDRVFATVGEFYRSLPWGKVREV